MLRKNEALRDLGKNDTTSHFAASLSICNKMIILNAIILVQV